MLYLILGLLALIILFVFSACVVSSRCSREEERINKKWIRQ